MRKLCGVVVGLALLLSIGSRGAHAQFKNGSQATELNLPRLSQRADDPARRPHRYHHRLSRSARRRPRAFRQNRALRKVWRAGANENTTISFTDDVSVEGHPLPAGTYGLHMIPNADQWTIIFSKNSTSWGSFSYDEKEDALRVNVKPAAAENRDSLAYTFDDMKMDSASGTLRWGKVAVPFHITVDTNAITERSINNQLRNVGGFTWAGYDEAGELESGQQLQTG